MVFRRRANLRPVNSRKHVIDVQGALGVDTPAFEAMADTVDAPVLANSKDVQTGCTINSIFLNIQVAATSTASIANVYMFIYKNPGANIPTASIPNGNVVGASDFKKQIFHQEMIMTEKNTTAFPRTLFKGVLKIPRHFRRFGYDDVMTIQLYSPGTTYEYCIQCIYKEYR